jgi:hypothetical protein
MNQRFFARLGLRGDEGKNLVPVDWLARAIVYLVTRSEHHGRTYHLASPDPVPVVKVQKVIRDAIEQYYPKPLATSISAAELESLEGLFYEYMSIYRSHWRDDPKFDLTNTRAALPHLPCPKLNYDALLRIARYPVERNFTPPRHETPRIDYDVSGHLGPLLHARQGHASENNVRSFGLQVNGPGGGQWQLHVEGDHVRNADWGLPAAGAGSFYLTAATFRALAGGELSIGESINSGRLVIEAAGESLNALVGILGQVASAGNGNHLATQRVNQTA